MGVKALPSGIHSATFASGKWRQP